MSAQRGSARRRASDSRRGASADEDRARAGAHERRDRDRVRARALGDERRDRPVGPLGQRVHAAERYARGFALEQAVGALELLDGRLGDRGRADVAVDARVDRAVLLARAAGDRATTSVAALLAQALALLVGGLARGRDGAEASRRSWR